MANVTVDLGYYSYRYTHARQVSTGDIGEEPSLPLWDDYIGDIRDRWKFVLENQNNGLDWRVGRVFRWAGALDHYASGFLIERLDGAGAKTNDEFLITYAGPRTVAASVRADLVDMFGANASDYYVAFEGETAHGHITIHYNYAALSDSYSIGAGADHDAPTVSPYTDPAGFFPDPVTQGVPFLKGMSQNALDRGAGALNDWTHCAVVNWDVPFITMYLNNDKSVNVRKGWVIGKFLEPSDPADLRAEGFFYFGTYHHASWDEGNDYMYVEAISPRSGESEGFNVLSHHNFLHHNQPPAYNQSTWYRDKVLVVNATANKGSIDIDVVSIDGTGALDSGSLAAAGDHGVSFQTAHGRNIKLLSSISTPWADGQSPPFQNWPKYPQELPKVGP